jgi:hypothetical protein
MLMLTVPNGEKAVCTQKEPTTALPEATVGTDRLSWIARNYSRVISGLPAEMASMMPRPTAMTSPISTQTAEM